MPQSEGESGSSGETPAEQALRIAKEEHLELSERARALRCVLQYAEKSCERAGERLRFVFADEASGRQEPSRPTASPTESRRAASKPEISLAGAFAKKKGLGAETKEERRTALELAELEAMAVPPAWIPAELMSSLRAAARASGGEAVTLAEAPVDVKEFLLRAKCIGRIEREAGEGASDGEPEGRWWACCNATKPSKAADECVLVCLGLTAERQLCGAIGWWAADGEKAAKAEPPLSAEGACRIALLGDEEGQYPAATLSHPTIVGIGANSTDPQPASQNLRAPMPIQLAESTREYLIATAQVNARLQRGAAAAGEKTHVRALFKEAHKRLLTCANEPSLFQDELLQVESAVQGLRKVYLRREWDARCAECGLRHTDIEKGTCKFWKQFAQQTGAEEDE